MLYGRQFDLYQTISRKNSLQKKLQHWNVAGFGLLVPRLYSSRPPFGRAWPITAVLFFEPGLRPGLPFANGRPRVRRDSRCPDLVNSLKELTPKSLQNCIINDSKVLRYLSWV